MKKSSKKQIDIRARLRVQKNSNEARIDEYLKDSEAIPYEKGKMIIEALNVYYSPLISDYYGETREQIRKNLIDVNKAWKRHFAYLQQRLGIEIEEEQICNSPVPASFVPVNYINSHEEQSIRDSIHHEPFKGSESRTEEDDGGSYPLVFE